MHSLKKSLRKKPFTVEDRTSIYLCHRLLFEFPENLQLFGHVLYNTDDYPYVESRPECLVIFALGTPLFSVFSPRSERFVIFALGKPLFSDFQRSARVFQNSRFIIRSASFVIFPLGAPLFSDFQQSARVCTKRFSFENQHVLSFSHWAYHFLALFSKAHQFLQYSVFSRRSAYFLIFALGTPRFSVFSKVHEFVRNRSFQPEIITFCHFGSRCTSF